MNCISEKLCSGRFWLTIITGLVFAYAVWSKALDSQAMGTIITMVFVSYFNKPDRNTTIK